jgi:hypothetical protein
MMMRVMKENKVILISSYCDTEEKTNILKNNINILYENNFDIILFTPFCVPDEIIEKTTYIILSKENPYTSYPEKSVGFWSIINFSGENYRLFNTVNDYGWSSLIQYKNMLDLAINREYSNFILMIYDTIIDEYVVEKIKNTTDTLMFPTLKKDGVIFPVGTQLMIFDKETVKLFYSNIFKRSYYKNNDVLETWLEKLSTFMIWKINDKPVVDGIQITKGLDQGLINNYYFKFLYSYLDNKICFYDIKQKLIIEIQTDNETQTHICEDNIIFDLENNHNFLTLTINDMRYELTKKIKNINYARIEKL